MNLLFRHAPEIRQGWWEVLLVFAALGQSDEGD